MNVRRKQFQIGYSDQSQQKQTARWSTRRSEFLPITWDLLKAREKSRVHGVIGLEKLAREFQANH